MASRLYEILEEQENGRKKCIANAKLANLPATDNMSYNSIADLFLLKNTEETILPNTPWQMPNWPDTKTILENAEMRENLYPIALLLIRDDENTSTFNRLIFNNYGTMGILTSDGEWYKTNSSTAITHTWDKTKDIDCDEWYKVRWVIIYHSYNNFTSNSVALHYNYNTTTAIPKNILQVVLGNFHIDIVSNSYYVDISFPTLQQVLTLDNGSYNRIGITRSSLDTYNQVSSLRSLDVKNCKFLYVDFNIYNLDIKYDSSLSNIYYNGDIELPSSLEGCSLQNNRLVTNLNITAQSFSNASCSFSNCPNLVSLSFPNLTTISTNGSVSVTYCENLKSLSFPVLKDLTSYNLLRNSYIETLEVPSLQTIYTNTYYNNCFGGATYLKHLHLPSTLTSVTNLDFVGCFSLNDLTIPNGWDWPMKVVDCPLDHDHLLAIVNALKDNSEAGVTRTITLGTNNIAKLSATELAIATDKGWTVA